MPLNRIGWCSLFVLALLPGPLPAGVAVAAADDPLEVTLAEGRILLRAPREWERKTPRTRIVEAEFSVPAAEADAGEGRLTIMAAGGSVEANLERWYGQFEQPDGKATKDVAKVEQVKVAGQEVHLVDIAGTYRDNPAPFAGNNARPVKREDYRMLGAIVVTDVGRYYVKLYGPKKTVEAHAPAFRALIESLQVKGR